MNYLLEIGWNRIDFRFDVIRWNFSNLSACFRLWFCLFLSTCTIVYYSFHFWAYKRLSFLSSSNDPNRKFTNLGKISCRMNILYQIILVLFDGICLLGYCGYIVLFLFFPVHYILEENYPIVTRVIILIEQVCNWISSLQSFDGFLLSWGSISDEITCICSREYSTCDYFWSNSISRRLAFLSWDFLQFHHSFLVTDEDVVQDKLNDSNSHQQTLVVPSSPCPEFSKFLYFIFAPTLIYRDSYPRTSSIRWKYVLTQLAQFIAAVLFSYYLFYRFCLPVFRHFNSEHVTAKIFILSILNCTLPGALLLFCGQWRRRVFAIEIRFGVNF